MQYGFGLLVHQVSEVLWFDIACFITISITMAEKRVRVPAQPPGGAATQRARPAHGPGLQTGSGHAWLQLWRLLLPWMLPQASFQAHAADPSGTPSPPLPCSMPQFTS